MNMLNILNVVSIKNENDNSSISDECRIATNITLTKIANPPSRGVVRLWIFISPGWSNARIENASFILKGTKTTVDKKLMIPGDNIWINCFMFSPVLFLKIYRNIFYHCFLVGCQFINTEYNVPSP